MIIELEMELPIVPKDPLTWIYLIHKQVQCEFIRGELINNWESLTSNCLSDHGLLLL